jgi:hypothetical protein
MQERERETGLIGHIFWGLCLLLVARVLLAGMCICAVPRVVLVVLREKQTCLVLYYAFCGGVNWLVGWLCDGYVDDYCERAEGLSRRHVSLSIGMWSMHPCLHKSTIMSTRVYICLHMSTCLHPFRLAVTM